jgi:hypothetical protein
MVFPYFVHMLWERRSSDVHSGDVEASFKDCPAMAEFDYNAAAELFPTRRRMPRRQPLGYRRFDRAAHAIRFAIEDLPAELLTGAFLEVDEERYNSDQIRSLYERPDYPLPRRSTPS